MTEEDREDGKEIGRMQAQIEALQRLLTETRTDIKNKAKASDVKIWGIFMLVVGSWLKYVGIL